MSLIIQREYTLDDALLECFGLHPNGCNYKLLFDNDNNSIKLSYGCMGVYVNLVQGIHRTFMQWFNEHVDENGEVEIGHLICPETIATLHKMKPCKLCGGNLFKSTTTTNASPYKISGKARKKLKGEISDLESFIRNYWHYEDIDRVYGGGFSDEECERRIQQAKDNIAQLTKLLVEKV